MFCKYCGTKLIDSAVFCHECGKATAEQPVCQQPVPPVPPTQPVYQQPVPPVQPVYQPVYQQPVQPVYQSPVQPVWQPPVPQPADPAQLAKLERQTLTFGILGLSLSMLGVPGIVLSGIAAKKAGIYKKLTGKVDGKVMTGYRLAKAGRTVGIIMTVLLSIIVPLLLEGDITYGDSYSYF